MLKSTLTCRRWQLGLPWWEENRQEATTTEGEKPKQQQKIKLAKEDIFIRFKYKLSKRLWRDAY